MRKISFLLAALLLLPLAACGPDPDHWDRIPCADAEELRGIVGESFALPEITGDDAWEAQWHYYTRRDVRLEFKPQYADGYAIVLTPVEDDKIVSISLRGRPVHDEEAGLVGNGDAPTVRETLEDDERAIEYREFSRSYQAFGEPALVYAYCDAGDIRYAVEIQLDAPVGDIDTATRPPDYRQYAAEYFSRLFGVNSMPENSE